MIVGERARVKKLERPTEQDRSGFEGRDGLLVRRLNVPWTPDYGALWQMRFDSGDVAVFAESELAMVGVDGTEEEIDMAGLREAWGDAPRVRSIPFRRLGGGSGAAFALLALLVFALAGILLIWAGISEGTVVLAAAGAVLVLIGIASAALLVS